MKKSDIIDLTIKIFGMYVIIVSLLHMKDIHYLSNIFSQNETYSIDILSLVLFLGGGSCIFIIGYILVFKSKLFTRKIIKEDAAVNLATNTNYKNILDLSLVIIALFIIIFKLPNLISSAYRFVTYILGNLKHTYDFIEQDIAILIQYILAYLLLTNSKGITNWIVKVNEINTKRS